MRENKTWTKPWSFGQLRKWEVEEAVTGERTKHQYELRCLINIFQCMYTGKLFMWNRQKVSFRGYTSLENTVPLEIYNAHQCVPDQNSVQFFFFILFMEAVLDLGITPWSLAYTHAPPPTYNNTKCAKLAWTNREGNGTPFHYSCLENPMDKGAWWASVHGVAESWTQLSDFTFSFHFHALEKEMAAHSSVLAWRIPGTAEPGGLPSMGSQSQTQLKRHSNSSSSLN